MNQLNFKINEICRVCLLHNENLINIHQYELAQNIMTITSTKIDYEDGFPQLICFDCNEQLNIAIKFKNKCEKSYLRLCEYFNSIVLNTNSSLGSNSGDIYNNDLKDSENISQFENTVIKRPYKLISKECYKSGYTELINFYECSICLKQDNCAQSFDQHICNFKNKLNNDIYTCNVCALKFSSNEEYNDHIKTHEAELKTNDSFLNSNLNTIIPKSMKKNNCIKKHKLLQCEFCGKTTKYQSELIRHTRLHSGERPFKCELCHKRFRCKSFLRKHEQSHIGKKIHHCLYCTKSFILKGNLNQHMKVHTNEKKYSCQICNKNFKSTRSLQNHVKIHTGERNFPCSLCDKAFINRFDLRRHLILHEKHKAIQEGTYDKSKEPPKQLHQCEHCGKFVPSKGDLTKHMRVHTKERPFKCKICSKSFASTSTLTVHRRTHTGMKPYTCQHCGLSFTQSSNLKVHVRLHTGIRPYICTICNQGFNRKRDLNAHHKKHSTDKL